MSFTSSPSLDNEVAIAGLMKLSGRVERFLSASARPAFTMNIMQLNGYLCALAGGPVLLPAKEWMPLVFADEDPGYTSNSEKSSMTEALLSLYNYHVEQVSGKQSELPFVSEYSLAKEERLDAEQWARGFLQGYILLQEIWNQKLGESQTNPKLAVILPTSVYDEIDDIIATVSAVADAEYAAQNGASVDSLKLMFNRLQEKILAYGLLGMALRNKVS